MLPPALRWPELRFSGIRLGYSEMPRPVMRWPLLRILRFRVRVFRDNASGAAMAVGLFLFSVARRCGILSGRMGESIEAQTLLLGHFLHRGSNLFLYAFFFDRGSN